MTPTSALVQWNSQLPEGVPPPNLELTYDLILGDRGRYKAIYSGPSLSCRLVLNNIISINTLLISFEKKWKLKIHQ